MRNLLSSSRRCKNAKTNKEFFEYVLFDLYNNHDNSYLKPSQKLVCKNQTSNLIYDGLCIYSYKERIFYKEYYPENKYYYLDVKLNQSVDLQTKNKIGKHFDELIQILEEKNYSYEFGIDEEGDEDWELSLDNPKKHWIIHNIKCSVEKVKETCSIDLEEYDELIKTKCGHLFCDKNLYSWLNEHNNKTCPLCRTKLL